MLQGRDPKLERTKNLFTAVTCSSPLVLYIALCCKYLMEEVGTCLIVGTLMEKQSVCYCGRSWWHLKMNEKKFMEQFKDLKSGLWGVMLKCCSLELKCCLKKSCATTEEEVFFKSEPTSCYFQITVAKKPCSRNPSESALSVSACDFGIVSSKKRCCWIWMEIQLRLLFGMCFL